MPNTEETIADLKREQRKLLQRNGQSSQKIAQRNHRIAQINLEIKRLEIPPQPSTTVITFEKLFATGPRRTYEYAAIKAGNLWYVTGASTKGYTWPELVGFIRKDSTLPFRVRPMHSLAQCDPPF